EISPLKDLKTKGSMVRRPERCTWSEQDVLSLQKYFRNQIQRNTYPTRKIIIKKFNASQDDVLEIWNRHDTQKWKEKCVNKVRILFRCYYRNKKN
ncbi:MAG: hypothetical protein AAF193_08555, partial [Bacteroidota bacterium]